MNDYSTIESSKGILKQAYEPDDETLEALRRRQEKLALEVKIKSQLPTPAG